MIDKDKLLFMLKEKKMRIAVAVGLVAILLIGLSSVFSGGKKTQSVATQLTVNDYVTETEQKLCLIATSIVGGKAEAMVTLENGIEYIYASETETDTQKNEDKTGEDKTKTQQNDSNTQKHIIIKNSNGDEEALVVTEIMPTVKGVVIVCDCKGEPALAEAVKSAVVTAMNISEKKVCVIDKS